MGLDLSSEKLDDMIVGDVTINNTTDTKTTSPSLPKWAGIALAAAGLGTGAAAIPLVASYLTKNEAVEVQPETPHTVERGGVFEIYRPPAVSTAMSIEADGATVYTSDSCLPCRIYKESAILPLIREGYRIRIVDIRQHPNSSVKAVPTTYFWRDGEVISKRTGMITYLDLKNMMTK